MITVLAFKESLKNHTPNKDFSSSLKSLWYDGKGDWDQAHGLIDQLNDMESAWVHAYLHRKECDLWNADYWYARAKKSRPSVSLEEEWECLVEFFLNNDN